MQACILLFVVALAPDLDPGSRWECVTHRTRDVEGQLRRGRAVFAREAAIWLGTGPATESEHNRVAQILSYRRRKGAPGPAVSVRRVSGELVWLSTVDLSGDDWRDRGSWWGPADAFEQFRHALELPGVAYAPSWCGPWKLASADIDAQEDDDRGAVVELRRFRQRKIDEVWFRVSEIIRARYGIAVRPSYIPDEVPWDEFVAIIRQVDDDVANGRESEALSKIPLATEGEALTEIPSLSKPRSTDELTR